VRITDAFRVTVARGQQDVAKLDESFSVRTSSGLFLSIWRKDHPP
jgi:hypothetical protein